VWFAKQPTKAFCGPSLRKLSTPVLCVCDKDREREISVNDDMICLLTTAGLTTGASSTIHILHTHKQYTEQHSETGYPERNIHNNKNT